MLEENKNYKPTKGVLIVLFASTIFLGLQIFPTYHFMLNEKSTYGRVIKWDGGKVDIRYGLPDYDSIDVRLRYPYTRDQKVIKSKNPLKVFYNSKRQHMIDIDGVRQHTLPLPMTIIFLVSLYATIKSIIVWYRDR